MQAMKLKQKIRREKSRPVRETNSGPTLSFIFKSPEFYIIIIIISFFQFKIADVDNSYCFITGAFGQLRP